MTQVSHPYMVDGLIFRRDVTRTTTIKRGSNGRPHLQSIVILPKNLREIDSNERPFLGLEDV